MPSQQRRDEVGCAEDVEAAGEDGTGDAVEAGGDPGDLGLVDGEVGGDGAEAALGGEDRVGLVRGGGDGWSGAGGGLECYGSVGWGRG